MKQCFLLFAVMVWLLGASPAKAQASAEHILPLDGRTDADGRAVEISWFDAESPRVGSVTVKRRIYGQVGGRTWQTLATGLGPVMRYRDEDIRPGVAYEYQVLRVARDIVDAGYWLTGTDIPAQETRGTAHLVIDTTLAEDLAPRLERFARDLTGDGWRVRRYPAPRGSRNSSAAQLRQASEIKSALRSAYLTDPFGNHAVILIGHVPLVFSGQAGPDGHKPAPHTTDLFYAETGSSWSAKPDGLLLHNTVPGDFIDMQIGRIDFHNLTRNNRALELRFLRAYLDKNHHWRMGLLGDLRMAYAGSDHLGVENAALRNIVGPEAVTGGHHHDTGEEQPWLWGVDFGDYNGQRYLDTYENKAVFTINFGSGKQRFNRDLNPMTALLAQPWYTLATGWGARPAWWLHHMALGGSIGETHMRTVNNGKARAPYRESMDYFPTGGYLWRNPVWVNLLGDPTTRAFPLAPPSGLVVTRTGQGMSLSWDAAPDADVLGYKIYRAAPGSTDFAPLAGGEVIRDLAYTDPDAGQDAVYMVRAYGRKNVYAGSFYTHSQGVFATPQAAPDTVPDPDLILVTAPEQRIALPDIFHEVRDGTIHAFIEGPDKGRLEQGATGWVYTPAAGFAGEVILRFSVSGTGQTTTGRLRLIVGG